MFNTSTTYTVDPKLRLDKIFTTGIPTNSFINKGRCGIGGTYLELTNEDRCSIIVVPNIPILKDKRDQHPNIDIVYGNVTKEEVASWFTVTKPGHKIMTTPEGIWKVIRGAEQHKRLDELMSNWFLMLDEAHTFISEYYRKGILMPFKHFWDFKNKCIISATPFFFSDERFRALNYHEIKFTRPLGTIHLVNAVSVVGTLNHILTNRDSVPGNLQIFYNAVTEIRNAILRAGLTEDECNIYCADDKEGNNMNTLGALSTLYKEQPKTGEYKKVNFYTGKNFEGWDLHDDDATMILVTDVYKPHTKVGVGSKGKQAIGRLRDEHTPHQILHITNHLHLKELKGLEAFRQQYKRDADILLKQNQSYLDDCALDNRKPTADPRLTKYADIDSKTQTATFNSNMLDQQINEAANNEIYNHIDYIKRDWEDGYYNVIVEDSDHRLETLTAVKRKSKSDQLKEDYERLLEVRAVQKVGGFNFGGTEDRIKESNPTAYLAAQHLDKGTMEELKYNVKKVSAEIIYKENGLAEVKLLRLLGQTFKVGSKYRNDFIKSKLQEFYDRLNIPGSNSAIRVATATQLGEHGRFEIKPGKDENGEHCMLIQRAQFNMRMAA